jgi:Ca2+-binding EF-hand superfamily protein
MDVRKLAGVVLVGTCFAVPAYAGDKGSHESSSSGASTDASREFGQLDKNKDGYISRQEAKGSDHAKDFGKYDANKDGKLSKDEFSKAEQAEESASKGSSSPPKNQK